MAEIHDLSGNRRYDLEQAEYPTEVLRILFDRARSDVLRYRRLLGQRGIHLSDEEVLTEPEPSDSEWIEIKGDES